MGNQLEAVHEHCGRTTNNIKYESLLLHSIQTSLQNINQENTLSISNIKNDCSLRLQRIILTSASYSRRYYEVRFYSD